MTGAKLQLFVTKKDGRIWLQAVLHLASCVHKLLLDSKWESRIKIYCRTI